MLSEVFPILQKTVLCLLGKRNFAQRRLKEQCVVKLQPQKSHEQDILQKHLQIDLCVLRGAFHELSCVFEGFYASGTLDSEGTKSLVAYM